MNVLRERSAARPAGASEAGEAAAARPRWRAVLSAWYGLAAFVASIWAVSVWALADVRLLALLALEPRTAEGLPGVVGMPLVHASMHHLVLNTVPLAGLGAMIALRGARHFAAATAGIVLVGGLALWAVGRAGMHIGASGLVFGYLGFILARGAYERRFSSLVLALVAAVAYGGILRGLFPTDIEVSFEGHLTGFAAGLVTARAMLRRPARDGAG